MPFVCDDVTILSYGKVKPHAKYHSSRYLWPIGFTSLRKFRSTRDPEKFVDYKATIVDNGDVGPLFCLECPVDDFSIYDSSSAKVWREVRQLALWPCVGGVMALCVTPILCLQVVALVYRQAAAKGLVLPPTAVHKGAVMFGYGIPQVAEAIEGLDNVPLCGRYVLLALRQPGKKARK